jgi:hypothetical protein
VISFNDSYFLVSGGHPASIHAFTTSSRQRTAPPIRSGSGTFPPLSNRHRVRVEICINSATWDAVANSGSTSVGSLRPLMDGHTADALTAGDAPVQASALLPI